VKFTIDPDAGHDSWTAAYDDPKLYEWLFAQQRKAK
jgi:predicted peptidase